MISGFWAGFVLIILMGVALYVAAILLASLVWSIIYWRDTLAMMCAIPEDVGRIIIGWYEWVVYRSGLVMRRKD